MNGFNDNGADETLSRSRRGRASWSTRSGRGACAFPCDWLVAYVARLL